jgi:hypothetical protein
MCSIRRCPLDLHVVSPGRAPVSAGVLGATHLTVGDEDGAGLRLPRLIAAAIWHVALGRSPAGPGARFPAPPPSCRGSALPTQKDGPGGRARWRQSKPSGLAFVGRRCQVRMPVLAHDRQHGGPRAGYVPAGASGGPGHAVLHPPTGDCSTRRPWWGRAPGPVPDLLAAVHVMHGLVVG